MRHTIIIAMYNFDGAFFCFQKMNRSRCVAVVGAACRFPGGESVDEFWKTLLEGRNLVRKIPADRWKVEAYHSPEKEAVGKSYIQHAGLLDE